MSPLPSTGISEHRGLQLADRVPVGEPGVVLLGRAGMQGDGGDSLVDGDAAGRDVGEQRVEQTLAELHVTGTPYGDAAATAAAQDGAQQVGLGRHGGARRPCG